MTAQPRRFVDWLADELYLRGTRFAFGVPGGGVSLDLLSAAQNAGVRTVITAREDAAAIMGGVAGRLSGAPGLAFSTKGPGLASAINGLASALLDRMPLLFVAEGFDAAELDYLSHQVFDQKGLTEGLFGGISGGKARAHAPGADKVARALDSMTVAPMGPAVLLADPDLMAASVDAPPNGRNASVAAVDPDAILRARDLIARARRPVIVAGLEATNAAAASGVRNLAAALGAPALVTYMAKGVVPDSDPMFAGIFTGGAIEQPTVGAADLIILAGLDPVELIRKPWPYRAPVLDLCPCTHSPHYVVPTVRIEGDLVGTLRSLTDVPTASDWSAVEIARCRERFLSDMGMPVGDALSPETVVREVGQAFEFAPRVTIDAGAHMFSACAFWKAGSPLDVLISNGLASMGFALPAAIAAALHDPGRGAVALTGDGGLMMCLGELKTAAAAGVDLTVVVFNDARLSLIDIKREQRQMQDLGLSWDAPDFARIADGFGFTTWTVRTREEMRRAARAAATVAGPRLIDARIDASGYQQQMRALRG